MIRFKNRYTGEFLELRPQKTYTEHSRDWYFYPIGSDLKAGEISFTNEFGITKKKIYENEIDLYGSEKDPLQRKVEIQDINEETLLVCGINALGMKRNSPEYKLRPGLGRLMMYLACKDGQERGLNFIKLDSVEEAAPFYRRMGMHHRDTQFLDLDPITPSHGGQIERISKDWLSNFSAHYNYARSHDHMFCEIKTVLSLISTETEKQWSRI
ncbi:hypothetical protein [Pseudochrobactrum sp. MP213Fo]|uniref:hypothetical protein n=1 Tax=Pseudochrobactrum sp. MP213Fo TaxID=3022250 RepID=UPI003BA36B28